jgi:hypothetical protein
MTISFDNQTIPDLHRYILAANCGEPLRKSLNHFQVVPRARGVTLIYNQSPIDEGITEAASRPKSIVDCGE